MPETLTNPPFIHLRLHTEFSISDGLINVPSLIERLHQLKMPAAAVTDLSNMFGLIKFYSRSANSGIKPICGCDLLIESPEGRHTHLVLLVKNHKGYLNLTNIISDLYTESETHSEPVVPIHKLVNRTDGLIALSGAQNSDIGAALLAEESELARTKLEIWRELFPGSFYLELQRVGKIDDERYIESAIQLAISAQCPVVATNDVRFLEQDDFDAHEVRVCINEGRVLDDPRRPHNYTDQQYLKSADEMQALFQDIPEALDNAYEIAKRCNLKLDLGTVHLPNYPAPKNIGLEDYLCQLSMRGLKERLQQLFSGEVNKAEVAAPYHNRLQTELDIINQMGFAGYYLIVMEFVQWAKDNNIPVGPGRGSGAGSIVAYALGITDLDPLKYDLLFERFLNPERVSMPDFDVDFCIEGRDQVLQHVAELYGKNAVSQIITFGTMAAKAVIRDVARVQGKPYALADKLSKLVPFEPGMTLKKAFEDEPLLGEFVDNNDDAQEIMEMAYKLEGITRNVGKHAGGVVIAPTKLTDFAPLYCDEAGQGIVTQFDKDDVETAGLVKFDFLGLRTLTIIDWAVKMINEQKSAGDGPVDINSLPLDDELVYRLLQRGETTAVFQLESRGMKDLIKRLVPNCFEDIIALLALFRPGPLQSGMVDDFINRKHGRTEVVYPHHDLEAVLSNTYGVILYQEQVMQIAQVLANYTLGGADILRKAMGKKNESEMAKQRATFTEGAVAKGVRENIAESIFDLMEVFAGYGFNRSHSAAYALIAYQTAWLKTYHPAYFMAATLSAEMQNTDKIVTLIDECRSMELVIIPPDVNIGSFNFTVNDNGEIVYGLGAIKGLGEGPVEVLLQARNQKPFSSLLDLCQRVDSRTVNRRTMEALIRSGALDNLAAGDFDHSRAHLSDLLPAAMQAAEQRNRNKESGVDDLFGEIAPTGPGILNPIGSRHEIKPLLEQDRLAAEKEALGLYLSGHPIDEFLPELANITKYRIAQLRPERGVQLVAGLLYASRTTRDKRGDSIAYLTLDDRSGRFEVTLYSKEYEKYRELIPKGLILVVECTVSLDDRNGGIRGRAKQIMTLDQARKKFAQRIALNLSSEDLQAGFCEHLANILSPYRKDLQGNGARQFSNKDTENKVADNGDSVSPFKDGCQVVINYQRPDSKGSIMLGQDWRVSPTDDLLQRLRMEFGKDQVELDYKESS